MKSLANRGNYVSRWFLLGTGRFSCQHSLASYGGLDKGCWRVSRGCKRGWRWFRRRGRKVGNMAAIRGKARADNILDYARFPKVLRYVGFLECRKDYTSSGSRELGLNGLSRQNLGPTAGWARITTVGASLRNLGR